MIGGDIIGQGTYGCAIVPPLLCKGRARQERLEQLTNGFEKTVGKLTLKIDADTELSISKSLRKEKLWKRYFILPEVENCEPEPSSQKNDWNDCQITSQFPAKDLRQLVSSFGGRTFASITDSNLRPGIFNFFAFMKHTLEACAILSLHGIVHYDLHKSNILMDSFKVPRLLDFGMSFKAAEIDDMILSLRWKIYDPKFDSEPPEVTVITGLRNNIQLSVTIRDAIFQKFVFRDLEVVFGQSREDLAKKLTDFCAKSKSFLEKDWVRFFKLYWPGFDSFALGAILINVLKYQLNWPEFTSSEEWLRRKDSIETILKGMLTPDPSERFDCVEALSLFDPESVVLKNSEAWLAARKNQRQV